MEEKFIQLNKSNVLRLGIKTNDGKDTGEYLEFDLEDIELPLRYQELIEEEKKNHQNIKSQLLIIDKKQDHKGKKLMSYKEEAKIKALNKFYKREAELLNKFLGDGGVEKLLNGRKLGWKSLNEIEQIIDEQISPHLDLTMEKIADNIKRKYSKSFNQGSVLELKN